MKKKKKKMGGFEYYRSRKQILEYMCVPAEKKLQWLDEMYRFNRQVALQNQAIAKIQEKLRRGEI